MAVIPEFRRRQLASSAVGVPNLGRSGEIAAAGSSEAARIRSGAVSRLGQTKFATGVSMANSKRQAVNAVSSQIEKVSAILDVQQKSYDVIEAADHVYNFKTKYQQSINGEDNQKALYNDPDGYTESVRKMGTDIATNMLKDIKSERVKQIVNKNTRSNINTESLKANGDASRMKITKAGIALGDRVSKATDVVANISGQNALLDFSKELVAFEQYAATITPLVLHKTKNPEYLKEGKAALTEAFINGQLTEDPVRVKMWLDDGLANKLMDSKDVRKLQKDANTAIKTRADNVEFNTAINTSQKYQKYANAINEGTLTPNMITTDVKTAIERGDSPEDIQALESMRSIVLKTSKGDVPDDRTTRIDLERKLFSLGAGLKEGPDLDNLESLIKLNRDIIIARDAGKLSNKTFVRFLTKLTPSIRNTIKKEEGKNHWFESKLERGYDNIHAWANGVKWGSDKQKDDALIRAYTKFVESHDNLITTGFTDQAFNGTMTNDQIDNIVRSIAQEEEDRLNPADKKPMGDKGKYMKDPKTGDMFYVTINKKGETVRTPHRVGGIKRG